MYSLPSTSQRREPLARCVKNGVPPTPLKARTGEFTPPGSNRIASCQSFSEYSHDLLTAKTLAGLRRLGKCARVSRLMSETVVSVEHLRKEFDGTVAVAD